MRDLLTALLRKFKFFWFRILLSGKEECVPTDQQAVLSELFKMKQQMDSLYAESVACVEAPASAVRESAMAEDEPEETWQPSVDILENDEGWMALLDLPGVDQADLNVEMANGRLTVNGRRHIPGSGAEEFSAIHSERPVGAFQRQFQLPAELSEDRVEAQLRHGVLTIRIAKQSRPARTRRIAIRAA